VVLYSLLLVPVVVCAYLLVQRRRTRYAVRFPTLELLATVANARTGRRRHIPPLLLLLALASLLVGLARPQATVLLPREEATVVLTLDSSGSMQATDVEPNRMDAAKAAATAFIDQLPSNFQIGIVQFSDRAHVLSPPTTDRTAVRQGIASLVASGPTAIGDAIVKSLSLNPKQSSRPSLAEDQADPEDERPLAAIVLLSDGSNTAGQVDPMEAAARAKSQGLPVFTIALGPPEGVEEPLDVIGGVPIPPPDYHTLRNIAQETGGRYFSAPTSEELRSIYDSLGSRFGFVRDRQEITFAFAAAGLVLAGAGAVLSLLWNGRFP
jgi:Ca-activated chloride channel family protein